MLGEIIEELNRRGEAYLTVKVKPKAPKTEVSGRLDDNAVKIAVAAPAEKNKANNELIKFLSQEMKVKKANVSIISGARERTKLIKIIK